MQTALPVLSLAEGLLTGNINLLKLPQADGGLSVEAVRCMLEIEPELRIISISSTRLPVMLLRCKGWQPYATASLRGGGDAAIEAVRRFAPVGAKLIEWGHRLSFAYISGYEDEQLELRALAEHIIQTKQLLCSSCQTIFLDTEDMEQVYAFCEKFLPYLEEASRRFPQEGIEETAEQTLRRYLDEMVQAIQGRAADTRVYRGEFCRLEACLDDNLVLSGLFGNCPVKRLPAARMLPVLRREKGRLQTAGLICAPERRLALAQRLMCAALCALRVREICLRVCAEKRTMGNIRCAGMCALWRWSPETQKETRHTARLLLWKNGMVKYSQRSHNAVGDVQLFQISNVFSAQADVQRTGRVIQVAGLRGADDG